jgi:uncharacterized DUF497 family protein
VLAAVLRLPYSVLLLVRALRLGPQDPRKARANQRKHGVAFTEAVTAFADPLGIIVDDDAHPERAILIGMSGEERILLTEFIETEDEVTRIISARLATRSERRRYEEGD